MPLNVQVEVGTFEVFVTGYPGLTWQQKSLCRTSWTETMN
jgi:hypothetical protein